MTQEQAGDLTARIARAASDGEPMPELPADLPRHVASYARALYELWSKTK